MKKVIEFLMWAFFGMFIMGVFVSLCGVGEFCGPLMLIGMGMVCVGFVLSVVCLVAWDSIESDSRK